MPYTNPSAQSGVYNVDATTILQGCGIIQNGTYNSSSFNVVKPSSSDSIIIGVTDVDIPATQLGTMYQVGLSNMKLRLASNVTKGDKLNIANTSGEWQKAPLEASNIYYVALENGTSGTNTMWAAPVATADTVTGIISKSFTTTTRGLNTAFQISTTRDAQVCYSVNITVVALLIAGTSGTVFLEYADNAGMTTNLVTVAQSSNSTGGVLSITNIGTANLSSIIPAGNM